MCQNMAENIKTSVEELRKLISIENVVGKPIDAGDQFLSPVRRMGVGLGACENILGNDGNDTVGAGAGEMCIRDRHCPVPVCKSSKIIEVSM